MPLIQELRLPFADDYTVDIQITIHADRGGYAAYIQSKTGAQHPLPIGIKQGDIEDLNSGLQKALQKLQLAFEEDGPTPERAEAVSNLAEKGTAAFNMIFSEAGSRSLIKLALRKARVVEVTSDDFLIPWESLYEKPFTSSVDILGFWGMRYILARRLTRPREADFESAEISHVRPRLGLAISSGLDHVRTNEIPALKTLNVNGIIELALAPTFKASGGISELKKLKSFLGQEREIMHFACHASDQKPPTESGLEIDDNFKVTIENFNTYNLKLKKFPFVFLNACRTGTANPVRTTNWSAQLWGSGARGVVATEFNVPDWFAAEFAKELYKRLLGKKSGTPIGESLLDTRRHFWRTDNNPLGLAYSLYSSPDLRFVRS